MSQLTVQQSYLLCWELLPDRNRKSMGLWYWELMSHPDPAVLPVGTLHSLEWFWVSRRIFVYSHHNTIVFFLRRPFVHGLFVSWGSPGWRLFVMNSRANTHVTIDCSTVFGTVVLGADESPWPFGTPSWYAPLSWMILSKHHNTMVFFSKISIWPSVHLSVCLSVCLSHLFDYVAVIVSSWNFQELLPMTKVRSMQKVKVRGQRSRSQVTTQLNCFRTVTPVWIHKWWWNDTYSLMLLRRCALLFFKVIRQISTSHGSKNH